MSFFNSEMYPSYETTKMSIGECFNMIKGGDLTVPSYQREYVWTKKDQEKYLYSISKGIPLFGPVINIISATGDQFIMDGQNRLMTIYKFMNDEVKLTNDDDEDILFSKLPDHEKRRFKNIKISYTETRDWSESNCQEFFYDSNQGGKKLKDGEYIHSSTTNVFNHSICEIDSGYHDLFANKSADIGLNITKGSIKRFGHFELIGTLLHMTRTNQYPQRPGKTSLEELKLWSNQERDGILRKATEDVKLCLKKYKQIVENVPNLRKGVKKEEHLRLLYLLFKSKIYLQELTSENYQRFDNLLNKVLSEPLASHIITWGTGKNGGVNMIYDRYFKIYTEL